MAEETGVATRVGAVVLVAVLTVTAAVAVSYGLARSERAWTIAGALVFAPVLVAATHAASRAVRENPRTAGAGAFSGLALLFLVVVLLVEPWWSTEPTVTGPALVIGSSEPSAHVYLRRVPGGAELSRRRDPAPLVANRAYRFSCEVVLPQGAVWLRLAEHDYWVPASALLTERGAPAPHLATC